MTEIVRDIVIVGGGYAGAVTALEVLRLARKPVRMCVVEPREVLGQGIAYSTADTEHRLNTRAKRMSLASGDESHFTRWARHHAESTAWSEWVNEDSFVPRAWFGRYVSEQLAQAARQHGGELEHWRDVVIDLVPEGADWRLRFGGADTLKARQVVLALGNLPRAEWSAPGLAVSDPRLLHAWDAARADIEPQSQVLVIGTGLTMIDALLTLRARGHRGTVHAVSRHGLLPQPHSDLHGRAQPLLARSLRVAARELRLGCELDKRIGRPWQWRIDANRHHAQAFWIGLSETEKRRFLRHARSYWDMHRHRVAQAIHDRIQAERFAGTLKIHAGRIGVIEPHQYSLGVVINHAGGRRTQLSVQQGLNSLGFELDYRRANSALLRSLFRQSLVRAGELGLGLDTDALGRIRAGNGISWRTLFTLGTSRIGQLWETTAAHEIRMQAAELAGELLRGLAEN